MVGLGEISALAHVAEDVLAGARNAGALPAGRSSIRCCAPPTPSAGTSRATASRPSELVEELTAAQPPGAVGRAARGRRR